MKIAINAGHHPDYDPGACGEYSQEADIVRDVGLLVVEGLYLLGHEAIFIQEDDLQDICDMANDFDAELFISIHCNAAESREAEGTETFYYEEGDESYYLAQCVQEQLVDTLQTVDRGLKDGKWLYVINGTDAPAVLTELAFISNPREESLLNNHIEDMADAIVRGIDVYLRGRDE